MDEAQTNRIVVGFPLYLHLEPDWFCQFMQMDHSPVMDAVMVRNLYLPRAMDSLVEETFRKHEDNWDALVVYEQDMLPPANAFERMSRYGPELDIVGSLYFKHEPPYHVMAWMQMKPPFYSPLTLDRVTHMKDYPAVYPVDAVAMGFTFIRRRVFEDWDNSIDMWDPVKPMAGHDLHFCNEAKKQGFNVWLDSGIQCGHLTPTPIGFPHFEAALAEEEPPTWDSEMQREGVTDIMELTRMKEMQK